jgi:hypothetical protein
MGDQMHASRSGSASAYGITENPSFFADVIAVWLPVMV